MKTLIAYFSSEFGNTKALAKQLAAVSAGDLFEIVPEVVYSKADLKYINPLARCNLEKLGKKEVPVKNLPLNLDEYDIILIGFPIWYGCAPNVVNTFCDQLDFTGKKVAAFATSGGSPIGKTAVKLAPHVKGADLADARLFNNASADDLTKWLSALN